MKFSSIAFCMCVCALKAIHKLWRTHKEPFFSVRGSENMYALFIFGGSI